MTIAARCSSCNHKLRVPDRLAGRLVACTKCGSAVPVGSPPPTEPERPPAATEEPPLPVASPLPRPVTTADRFGVTALTLGLVSILILCLPYIGYGAILLSGVGIFLGAWGMLDAGIRQVRGLAPSSSEANASFFSRQGAAYAIAGAATCMVTLALALLPHLHW